MFPALMSRSMSCMAGRWVFAPVKPASVYTLKILNPSWLAMKERMRSSWASQELNSTSACMSVETRV
ncbi:MAG: hypothetical protein IPN65_05890 [Elusimicrobia bacterium]|nr:hypothetical protein [Elusimicrobiota bacterium]MBK7687416.1 hypothetical protein [Elusimicrobiota bacterium]MBK9430013.1 hypothetical protein [Elusimicrobiota bacterium]MBP8004281.1 hypothetical protein [Elusimicrobiota bacterium]